MIYDHEHAENRMSLSPGKGRGKARGTTLVCEMPCWPPRYGAAHVSRLIRALTGASRVRLAILMDRSPYRLAGHFARATRRGKLAADGFPSLAASARLLSWSSPVITTLVSICHDRLTGNRRNVAASGCVWWRARPSFRPPQAACGWLAFRLSARATSLGAGPMG